MPARLRDLAPGHAPYRGLTGVKLREVLEREYGIKVASTGNRYAVDPNKTRACIVRLPADDLDDRSSSPCEVIAGGRYRPVQTARSDTSINMTFLTSRRSPAGSRYRR